MDKHRRLVDASGMRIGRYILSRMIGKGVSGEVWLATDVSGGNLVALKVMRKEWIYEYDQCAAVQREIDILRELDHPCVVKLIDVFNSEDHVFLAMEAVPGRDLHEELRLRGRMGEDRARGLFQQLMMAVQYLHSRGVAHRDIKAENVLLGENGTRVYLADFGLATRLDKREDSDVDSSGSSGGSRRGGGALRDMTKIKRRLPWWRKNKGSQQQRRRQQSVPCGTPAYVAPEVITSSDKQRYDGACVDTWCSAVCLYAMVTETLPFGGQSVEDTLAAIQTVEPEYPEYLSALLTDLLKGMLRKDPSERLAVAAVLSHPWTTRGW